MPSRGQAITITYVAWDTAQNQGKTGDAANHTLRWIKDGTPAAPANSPAEVDATSAPGVYRLALTAAECTCDFGDLAGTSSTADVSIIPKSVAFEQLPTAAPAAAGGLATVDGDNKIAGVQGVAFPANPAAVGSAMTLTAAERTAVADAVLTRDVAAAESGAAEHSLTTVVLAMLESSVAASVWTIRRTGGGTHATRTVATDPNAHPITGVS
jgi:hypothetical protein